MPSKEPMSKSRRIIELTKQGYPPHQIVKRVKGTTLKHVYNANYAQRKREAAARVKDDLASDKRIAKAAGNKLRESARAKRLKKAKLALAQMETLAPDAGTTKPRAFMTEEYHPDLETQRAFNRALAGRGQIEELETDVNKWVDGGIVEQARKVGENLLLSGRNVGEGSLLIQAARMLDEARAEIKRLREAGGDAEVLADLRTKVQILTDERDAAEKNAAYMRTKLSRFIEQREAQEFQLRVLFNTLNWLVKP